MRLLLREGWRKDQTSKVLRHLLECKTNGATPGDNLLALAEAMEGFGRDPSLFGAVALRFYDSDVFVAAPHWPPGEGVKVAELPGIWGARQAQREARAGAGGERDGRGGATRRGGGGNRRLQAQIRWLRDIKPNLTCNDLIKGLVGKGGLGAVVADSSGGKTAVVVDMMLHLAAGIEYRGRRA